MVFYIQLLNDYKIYLKDKTQRKRKINNKYIYDRFKS